ncbi:MarR family winged helix-turn-helix transcriptional regulator [Sediminitomix flava]|uniref:DNA-binding MarR family transcriptional regulator n=1 Tax=Sediminitomix flava TaxID=379075 RepID=A0A315ZYF0_SEDFL|nr:MarR family transcriptional regulator [Sediminitomix flava]PWJ42387.1 DNA-binding MarR family transcriptional regulator [Sediminitomix flava]
MQLEEEIKQKKFKDNRSKALLNILFTSSWINGMSLNLLKPYGISPQQYNILRILKGSYPDRLSVHSIKERMIDKTPNVTRLVDRLLDKELVTRERCTSDRRMVFVSINEKGLEFMETLNKVMEQNDNIMEDLTEEEAEQLSMLLDKVRAKKYK